MPYRAVQQADSAPIQRPSIQFRIVRKKSASPGKQFCSYVSFREVGGECIVHDGQVPGYRPGSFFRWLRRQTAMACDAIDHERSRPADDDGSSVSNKNGGAALEYPWSLQKQQMLYGQCAGGVKEFEIMDLAEAFSSLYASDIGLDVILSRLLAACFLGALLGIDREILSRPAGLRTYVLVSLAAATFTVVTFEILDQARSEGASNVDPIRIVEAVTAGVAFLAAGAIIQARGKVHGVTTGAGCGWPARSALHAVWALIRSRYCRPYSA